MVGFAKKSIQVYRLDPGHVSCKLMYSIPCPFSNTAYQTSHPADSITSKFGYIKKGGVIDIHERQLCSSPDFAPGLSALETRFVRMLDENFVVTGGEDGTIRMHRVYQDGVCLVASAREHESVILGCTKVMEGGIMFTCGAQDSVIGWRVNSNQLSSGFRKVCPGYLRLGL